MSIVNSIVSIAENAVRDKGVSSVNKINLEIGALAGIEPDALYFAWDIGVKNTILERAERVITWVNGEGYCPECENSFHVDNYYDGCPNCENYLIDVRRGQEMRVVSLLV